jgi:cytosol alanyl aminopeptidase
MENPGLITYDEAWLLVRPGGLSLEFEGWLYHIVVHELAHQWFGNLVTMAWWNDLWLNEAFSDWMTHGIIRRLRPEWSYDVTTVRRAGAAKHADATPAARKIRRDIAVTEDIEGLDILVYQKGAAVIGMFEGWIGEERFRDGLRAYLAKHAWGNATAADFFAAIGAAAGRDVATPFSTFLDQPGTPLVSFALVCAKGRSRLLLEQQRYLPRGSKLDEAQLWQVPVCVRLPGDRRACTLLTERRGELELDGDCPAWVMPNGQRAVADFLRKH